MQKFNITAKQFLINSLFTVPEHDILIIFGDFNAKFGNSHNYAPEVIGQHGLGVINDNGL